MYKRQVGCVWWWRTESFAAASNASATGSCSIAIGFLACSATTDAIALGAGVTAAKTGTVTVKELETCVAGGGIYLTTPDGTAQPKLTVNDSQELLIGGNPVGGAGLVSGSGCNAIQSSSDITSPAASASGGNSIALGRNACSSGTNSIAMANYSKAAGNCSIAIGATGSGLSGTGANAIGAIYIGSGGDLASVDATWAIAIGGTCTSGDRITIDSTSNSAVAIGRSSSVSAGAARAVALGAEVTAAKADTVTVRELETCVAGGGITLKSADATEEKMTLTDADVLAVGGDTIPANDSATPTVVNRIWSGSQAQYDALGSYDANTLYYIA